MQNDYQNCDPVEIVEQKSGIKKIAYICQTTIKNKANQYKENPLHFWTDFSLIATIIVLISIITGLWIFNTRQGHSAIEFTINYGQEELINGQRVNFQIAYENTTKKKLYNINVVIKHPEGLTDREIIDPRYNHSNDTLTIGTLESKEKGVFDFKGLLLANINEPQKFIFVLNYTNQIGQPQQELITKTFVVSKSIAEMSFVNPENIIIDSEFPSEISIQNTADYTLENISLQLIFPYGYNSPKGSEIGLSALNSGQTIKVPVEGSLNKVVPSDYIFDVALVQEYQGRKFILQKIQKTSKAEYSKVLVSFINTEKNKAVKPGEETLLTLEIHNSSDKEVGIESASIKLGGDYLNIKFLETTFPEIANGIINLPSLSKKIIPAGEKVIIEVPIKASEAIQISSELLKPQDLTAKALIKYLNLDNPVFVNSQQLNIPVNSKITAQSRTLFFTKTGDQIGVGSLPPQVGEFTGYWAVISVGNGANQLNNVFVRGTLGQGVEFTEQYNVTHGTPIRFIPQSNSIEWYMPQMNPYVGILEELHEGRILLAIVPSEDQVGKVLTLLDEITITGTDARTGETITTTVKPITTIVSNDQTKNRVSN